MKCLFCPGNAKVIDSREMTEHSRRRIHKCVKCKKRFKTIQRVDYNWKEKERVKVGA